MEISQMPPAARLLESAEALFQKNGFHATGIDAILNRAGIAKMTLYRNYASKDELITVVLRLKSRKTIAWLEEEIARRTKDTSASKIEALFDAYGDWFMLDNFKGCLFTKAALEYPDPNHPAHKVAATHTRKLFALIETIPPPASQYNAEHILLLLHGALTIAALTKAGRAPAERAKQVATNLFSS